VRLISPLRFFALALVLLTIDTLPGYSATNNIYMSIETAGEGQPLKRIPVESVSLTSVGVESSRDSRTGKASGKRQHAPIKITKEVDAASPRLERMAIGNEVLKLVVLEFTRSDAGKQQVYRTVKLVNARVAGIQKTRTPGGNSSKEIEEISLIYQEIQETNNNGGIKASDSSAK